MIQIFLGYNNYIRSGKFYVMTADTKLDLHRDLVSIVVPKKLKISQLDFNKSEGLVVSEWLDNNEVKYSNKDKLFIHIPNYALELWYRIYLGLA